MNKNRRKEIVRAVVMIEEQESYDNLPDSLQGTERGEGMCEWIDRLGNACDYLQNVLDEISE